MAPDLPGYTIVEDLHRDSRTVLARAIRRSDGRRVLVERPLSRQASGRLRAELELWRFGKLRRLVRPLEWEERNGQAFLVRDDVGGEPLERTLGRPMPIDRFLDLSCAIAANLVELHRKGIVHRDLRPRNILVDMEEGEAWLLGLGIASRLPGERMPPLFPARIEGSLAYISPEQTGRTSRFVDGRSDLYSLGVIFFEMLTGELPFQAQRPSEWIHQHLAMEAPSPSDANPSVPAPLGALVHRLLAKLPEDRYQSARGLLHDLQLCKEHFEAGDTELEGVVLKRRDVAENFVVPRRLYDRAEERRALREALAYVLESGAPALQIVSGFAGIGKSTLIRDLLEDPSLGRGFFIEGAFDRYARNSPYSGIIRAFRQVLAQILGDSEERRAAWRRELSKRLAPNAQLLIDLMPELERLIGPQPAVLPLPPLESMSRFHDQFLRFVQVLASQEHPMILFLDNLHWSDPASIAALERVLTDPRTRNLFVLGSFQDDKLDENHPLLPALERLRRSELRVDEIPLGPLSAEAIAAMLSESLGRPVAEVAELAELIHLRTGGNPLFAIQLLGTLADEELLRFDPRRRRWSWDLEAIRERAYSDDVLDLLISRLVRLPPSTRKILPIAACLGNSSELETLAMILEEEEDSLREKLIPALEEGILSKCEDSYRFVHDRVQQAAHRLVDTKELAGLHARIGRLLHTGATSPEDDAHLFEITDHLNKGVSLLDRPERRRLVELNVAAGRKAFRAAGFCLASSYFSTAAALLGDDPWERTYELAFATHLEWAKAAFLRGARDEAWEILEELRGRTKGKRDLAELAVLRINFHAASQERSQAIEEAVEALERLGVELRDPRSSAWAEKERSAFERALDQTSIAELAKLPWVEGGETKEVVDVIAAAALSAAASDPNAVASLSYLGARLALEEGLTESAPVVLAFVALVMGQRHGAEQRAYELGRLCRELVDRHELVAHRTKVYTIAAWTSQWRVPLEETAELLRRAVGAAPAAGDRTFANFAHYSLVSVLRVMGHPLSKVQSACEDALAASKRGGEPQVVEMLADERRFLLALQGSIGRFSSLRDELLDEEAESEDTPLPIKRFTHQLHKLQALFLLGDVEEARGAADLANSLLWTAPSSPEVPEFHFYDAVASSSGIRSRSDPGYEEILEKLHRKLELFDAWAAMNSHTFPHQAALIRAELARLEGDAAEAIKAYQRAARVARERGFVQHEAIAYELAAAFYRTLDAEEMAIHNLRSARACFLAWGAEAKVHDLDRRFPGLQRAFVSPPAPVVSMEPEELDWASVMEAVQTISKEIGREELVERLVHTLMEQGVAQRASFIFRRDATLRVEAEAELRDGRIETSTTERPLSPKRDPLAVIRYVLRTGDRIIEDDASAHPRLRDDEYIASAGVRSLLCLPVMERSGVRGLIVMENDLVAGAFSADRMIALEILAVQAAISLEISLLVDRERDRRRKAEEEQRRTAWLSALITKLRSSLGPEELAKRLADTCVPFIADIARIDVVDPSGVVRNFGLAAAPGFDPRLLERAIHHTKTSGIPDLPPEPIQERRAVLIADMDELDIRAASMDDAQFRFRRKLGLVSAMGVPLLGRRGLIGVITLARRKGRPRFDEDDLDFMVESASRIAVAFENAELFRAAREAIDVRDEFLSIASHELRTPITSLLLTLQRLRRKRPDSPEMEGFDRGLALAERQTKRITTLTEILLDVARIQGGRLDLDLETFDLGELIEEVCPPLAANLRGSAQLLEIRLPKAPLIVEWDRMRIEQVLTNLVTNALKFGEGGPVEVEAYEEDGWIRIDVRDHGVGLSAKAQENLFQKFERGDAAKHGGGLGLGLYITRKIVEAHAGKIQVKSRLGKGSTFSVRLPPTARMAKEARASSLEAP